MLKAVGRRLLSSANDLKCLVLVEHRDGKVASSSLPVLSAAQQLTSNVFALVAGDAAAEAAAEEISSVASLQEVILAKHDLLRHSLAEPLADVIAQIQKKFSFSHVLAPASTFGKNVLPRAAGLLGIEQISDVIGIVDRRTFHRPIYAGNAIATVTSPSTEPCVLTVRPTAFEAAVKGTETCEIVRIPDEDLAELEVWSSKIVVSGGRALQSKENFKMVEELAEQLGAAVGATRAAVDAGFAPNEWQVGQTGKVVAPELYIALGISGAIQHLAGMTGSKTIVAINTDPDAPIFEVADYGLVQDVFTALPELAKEISKLRAKD